MPRGLPVSVRMCYGGTAVRVSEFRPSGGLNLITVVPRIPAKEGKLDEALKDLGELIPKVASEEGTRMYSLNRDKANPNLLVVVEQYKDKAALEFHSSTAHFKSFFTAAGAFIGGKPEMSFLEQVLSI